MLALKLPLAVLCLSLVSSVAFALQRLEPSEADLRLVNQVHTQVQLSYIGRRELDLPQSVSLFCESIDPMAILFSKKQNTQCQSNTAALEHGFSDLGLRRFFDLAHTARVEQLAVLDQFTLQLNDLAALEQHRGAADQSELDVSLRRQRYLTKAFDLLRVNGYSAEAAATRLRSRFRLQAQSLKNESSANITQQFINHYLMQLQGRDRFIPRDDSPGSSNISFEQFGIGIRVLHTHGGLSVGGVVVGGPADLAGNISKNDCILGLKQGADANFTDTRAMPVNTLIALLQGIEGSRVMLELLPGCDEAKPLITVEITRGPVVEPRADSVIATVLNVSEKLRLGVVTVSQFYADFRGKVKTSNELEQALSDLARLDVDGVLIDLRANQGGSFAEVASALDLLLPKGPILQLVDTHGLVAANSFKSFSPGVYKGPLVVLVDQDTAAGAEIFAAALQDYSRAVIVGYATFGNGGIQTAKIVDDGMLLLTTAMTYRLDGRSVEPTGVLPDILLPQHLQGASVEPPMAKFVTEVIDPIEIKRTKGAKKLANRLPEIAARYHKRHIDEPAFSSLSDQARQEQQKHRALQILMDVIEVL